MNEGSTTHLIRELSHDLEAVRPVPSLRSALGLGVVAWLAFGTAALAVIGVQSALWENVATHPDSAVLFVGLIVAALAATLATAAGSVPGRDGAARAGLAIAVTAMLLAGGLCLASLAALGFDDATPAGANAMCLGRAAWLSAAAAVPLVAFSVRGWVARPWISAVASLVGAGAVASLTVHLSCSLAEPSHLLIGHASAPLLATLLATPLVAWLLKRMAR